MVGVTGALTAIRDGDVVEMDGSTGEIRVLEWGGRPTAAGASARQ